LLFALQTIVRVRLVPSPDELRYKEDRARGVELTPYVTPASRDQPSADTDADQPETSHGFLKQPTEVQVEPPLPQEQEQVDQHVVETNPSPLPGQSSGQRGKKRRAETSERHPTSRRHRHSRSYKILSKEISAVRTDLANLTTMVREQHDHLSQQIDDLRKFIERLCQVRLLLFVFGFFFHTYRI